MARWILSSGLVPDRILSSSALRARETAQHVADTFGMTDATVEFDDELYGAGFRTWLGRLRAETVERLLICGHNPSLDLLVESLSDRTPPLSASGKLMTTAAIAHLRVESWADLAPSGAALMTIARPREL